MSKRVASTLSEHLLREAERFRLYPQRVYRTRVNRAVQDVYTAITKRLIEWRKTFSPHRKGEIDDFLTSPVFLDEFYCRESLRAVPGMVERTRQLSELTLADVSESDVLVYLRESANCYIAGLPQATVALARAATEARVRQALARLLGEKAVRELELVDVINRCSGRLLTDEVCRLAHAVRVAANDVLHQQPTELEKALAVFEGARRVISELRGR